MSDKTGGQLVVELLVSLGVRHVFGVVGGQTLAITDALIDTPEIEFIHTRHEGAAAAMADAYGRLTGNPAVCIATTGPGATNLLTGVGGARRDSSPALVITCNNVGENIHRDDAQNADHVELFKPITKFSRLVAHQSSIKQAMEEAFVVAMTGTPGPVHLDFARDTIEQTMTDVPDVPVRHPSLEWVGRRPAPNARSMARAAAMITEAHRPVLWLGAGVQRSNAGPSVLRVAEMLSIPVVTTFNGIGCVPTAHPLVFGAVSRMGTNLSTRVIEEADLVVALGNSLNAVSTSRWRRTLPRVLHVDIDPAMIGRYYADVTTGVISDAAAFVNALEAAVAESVPVVSPARTDWITDLQGARVEWWAKSEVAATAEATLPSPADVVRSLRDVTADETILIPDAGNPGIWSFLWEVRQIGTYIKPVGFGNMGFALPAAIASVAIDPARPVLALIGDGSLGMSLGELETLARIGGPVAIVVMNDSSYGNIRQEQALHFNGRTIGVDFGDVDFGAVARGMGVTGIRTTDLHELHGAVQRAHATGVPVVVDVPIDRDVDAWTYGPFQTYVAAT